MPPLTTILALGLFFVVPPVSGSPHAAGAPKDVIITTSAAPMLAVARLMTENTWNPILDRRVQDSPLASGLGAVWGPADPRWQKARQALGARMTRILEAYAKSNELRGHIDTEIGRIGQSAALDEAVATLAGPNGSALVRREATLSFIVSTLSDAGPNGPATGSPEWTAQLKALTKDFDDHIGVTLPPVDPRSKAEVDKLALGPVHQVLSRLWTFVTSNATRQLKTAINLMLFDDQAAIDRDIAAAIGTSGSAAAQPAATFSLERMATCQDSWLAWKDDPVRMRAFGTSFQASFRQKPGAAFFVPIKPPATVAGLPVAQVYPESVGMGVGFSVAVEAAFEKTRKSVEQLVGKPLTSCETSDNMHTCSLELGEKKTILLMADASGKSKTTLVGCFYLYEK